MSKKASVSYVKPDEPAFLTRLKQQAGYVPKDTVDTKKQILSPSHDDDNAEDNDGEQPVIVVLKPGDLSAEEVLQIQEKQRIEECEAPADLSRRVLFKAPAKSAPTADGGGGRKRAAAEGSGARPRAKRPAATASLLSFGDGEDHDGDL